ncbi:hypothetical protein M8494_30920 [Serratia ureilytica]
MPVCSTPTVLPASNLASDERMLPPNLRGYAALKYAASPRNARITVSGPHAVSNHGARRAFAIQDLSSSVRGQAWM